MQQELLKNEQIKITQKAQDQKRTLGKIFQAAGVSSLKVICDMLDGVSENLKKIAQLENSQQTLQIWNDVYRGQKALTLKLLEIEGVDSKIIKKVEKLYSARSSKKLVPIWESLTDWESSEIISFLKKAGAFKYTKTDI